MAIFPNYGHSITTAMNFEVRRRVNEMGDGYIHVEADGINNVRQTYTLVTVPLGQDEFEATMAFCKEHAKNQDVIQVEMMAYNAGTKPLLNCTIVNFSFAMIGGLYKQVTAILEEKF